MSRLIDADALKDYLQSLAYEDWNKGVCTSWSNAYYECADIVDEQPTIEPDRKNGYRDGYKRGKQAGYKKGIAMRSRITLDVIKDFHDYQVGWLTSHHDITLSPEEENLILNFLHDTADCYVLEVGALR